MKIMINITDLARRGWKVQKLFEVAQLIKDVYRPHKGDHLPYIGLEHIQEQGLRLLSIGDSDSVASQKFRFKRDDVLFGKLRPYFRKVVKPNISGVCSTDIWVVRALGDNDQNYLFYFLANQEFVDTANSGDSGTRMPRADWNFVKDTTWQFPPLREQRAIAAVLSSLDDKIDLLHRQNKTMESLVRTLFKKLFVCDIEKTILGKLGDLIEVTFGGEWGKEVPEGEFIKEVQCIRGTDIADMQIGLATRAPIRFVKEKKFQSVEPADGDLLIEVSGGTDDQSTGRAIYINNDVKELFSYPLVFSNFCRLLRLKRREYMFYLYCYINMLYDQGDFFNLENGSSGIKNFDYKAFLFELEYDIHSEETVANFNKEVEPFFGKINKNKSQIKNLIRLRETLLPKLMSGEVRVKNG
jgi:type I restriction enzyme S subunit